MSKPTMKKVEEEWNRIFMFVRGEKPTVRLTDLVKSKWPKLYNKIYNSWGFAGQAIVTGLLDQSGVDVIDAERDCDCAECVGKGQNDRPHDIDVLVKLGAYEVPIQIGMFEGTLIHDSDVVDKEYGAVDIKCIHKRDTKLVRRKIRQTPPGGITLLYTNITVSPDGGYGEFSYDAGSPDDDWWYEGVKDKCIILWRNKSDKAYHVASEYNDLPLADTDGDGVSNKTYHVVSEYNSADTRFVLARSGTCSIYYGVGGCVDVAKELCDVLGHERIIPQVIKPRHSPKIPKDTPPMSFCPRTVDSLKKVVSAEPKKWTSNPDSVIAALYYPDYARVYFEALGGASKDVQTDGLVPILRHVVERHGESAKEGTVDEEKWRRSVSAALSTLKVLAETNNIKFDQNIWAEICCILKDIVVGRHDAHPCETLTYDEIYKRPYLQALLCVTHMVDRLRSGTPPEVRKLLTTVAQYGGQRGREYRIVLGYRLETLRSATPDWYVENELLLFGENAPDGMNSVLMRVYLRDRLPDKQTMENYHTLVLDALAEEMSDLRVWESKTGNRVVKNDPVRHFMICVLHGLRGYGIEGSVRDLARIGPNAVSVAGHECGHLIHDENIEKKIVERAVQFWEAVLDSSPEPEALYGFGWWALAKSVNQDTWERLMLCTCEAANGMVENPYQVFERASSDCNPTATGIRIIESVLRANKWIHKDCAGSYTLRKMRENNVLINIE